MREFLLFLSRRKWLRRFMERSRLAKPLVQRFVAGQNLQEAIGVCQSLHQGGVRTTMDYLGENVRTREEAEATRDAYLEVLARVGACSGQPSVSIKLTQFGLDLDEELCRANAEAVVRKAKELGARVEIDMESADYVDRTLAVVRDFHREYGNVRAVIQAYLRRSGQDVRALCEEAVPIRLCKGAYWAPPEIAYEAKADVDRNYLELMQYLLARGTFPAIATHDEAILKEARATLGERGSPTGGFEFQMLYGVRRDLQQELVSQGFPLRLYVPFGEAWYPYFMRRLAERPANLFFLMKNLVRA